MLVYIYSKQEKKHIPERLETQRSRALNHPLPKKKPRAVAVAVTAILTCWVVVAVSVVIGPVEVAWGMAHRHRSFGPVFLVTMCGGHWNKSKNPPPSHVLSEGEGSGVVGARIEEMPPPTRVLSEGG